MSAVFQSIYRNYGIYWHGGSDYGDETQVIGTVQDCRNRIDQLHANAQQAQQLKFDSAALKGVRDGDNATITLRGEVIFAGTIREARRRVFDIEETTGEAIAWL